MVNGVDSFSFFFKSSQIEVDYRNLKVAAVAIAALGLIAAGVSLSLIYKPVIAASCSVGVGLGMYGIWWRLKAPNRLSPLLFCCAAEEVMDEVPKNECLSQGSDRDEAGSTRDRIEEVAAGDQTHQGQSIRRELVSFSSDDKATLGKLAHRLRGDEFLLCLARGTQSGCFVLSRLGDQALLIRMSDAIMAGRRQVDFTEFERRPEYVIKVLETHLRDGEYVRTGFNQYRQRVIDRWITIQMVPRNGHEVDLETLHGRSEEKGAATREASRDSVYHDAEG